ncbi:MAG: hypothetical protein Fur0037_09810 [Planctomycetota bacterium]
MVLIQRLPYLGTAEEDVLLAEWRVADGQPVRRGETIAVVETLKATFEVEAERDGVLLRRLAETGSRVPIGEPIAAIGDEGEVVDERALRLAHRPAEPPQTASDPTGSSGGPPAESMRPAGAVPPSMPAAPAARRRASELGVDLERVRGTGRGGMIRVEDVERAAASTSEGIVDPEFLRLVRADARAFGGLSSDLKVALYRRHGASIGLDCRIGEGTVLLAGRLVLGRGAFFGPGCLIEARELAAGSLLHFGAYCRVRATRAAFGDNAFFTDHVEIGGGGAMDPEALIEVGSHGFVGEHAHLNPCRPIRIGDEVVISRNAVIMTHSFGASALAGYPNRFAGVRIGDRAQIGIGAVLFPGTEVGEGAIVMSGSSLVSSVPPGRMFGGVPARDLKAAARSLSAAERTSLAADLVEEFGRQLELRGREVERGRHREERRLSVADGRNRHLLRFCAQGAFEEIAGDHAEEIRVAMAFPEGVFDALPRRIAGIELDSSRIRGDKGPLACAFREFLRKRGIRLEPRAWSYTGGWL